MEVEGVVNGPHIEFKAAKASQARTHKFSGSIKGNVITVEARWKKLADNSPLEAHMKLTRKN